MQRGQGRRAHYDVCCYHVFHMSCFLVRLLFSIHVRTRSTAQPMTDVCWPHQRSQCWDTVLYGNVVSSDVGVFWVLSLRSQNTNSKTGLGLSFQKVLCIALILLSMINTLLIRDVRDNDYYWTQKIILGIYIVLFNCKVFYIINHARIACSAPLQYSIPK